MMALSRRLTRGAGADDLSWPNRRRERVGNRRRPQVFSLRPRRGQECAAPVQARRNAPDDIRVAVPWYKPARNLTDRVPDYYLHETAQWIKFPHSLEGLSEAEIQEHRPELHEILAARRFRSD